MYRYSVYVYMYSCVCVYVYNHPEAFAHSETFKKKVCLKLTLVIKNNIFLLF